MTDVLLTVDLEFDVNGFITQPDRRRPAGSISVRRPRGGIGYGIEKILETAEKYRIPITFFVEVFNAHYFGFEEMGRIVEEIQKAGRHDIQLHTHPVWRLVGGKTTPAQAVHDRADRSAQRPDSDELIAEAVELFHRMMGYQPIAFRPGSFNVDRNLLRSAAKAGIRVTSSCALTNPSVDRELHLGGGIHRIDGVLEVPITAFRETGILSGERFRSATLCGNALPTLKSILTGSRQGPTGSPIVLLTHASEFSTRRFLPNGFDYLPMKTVMRRFSALCHFIDGNRQHLNPTTFAAASPGWQPVQDETRRMWSGLNALQRAPQLFEEFAKKRFLPARALSAG